MLKQPSDSLVSTVATVKAPDLVLEEIEHDTALPASTV